MGNTTKLIVAILLSIIWVSISVVLGLPWIDDLAHLWGYVVAWTVITGLAFIPGAANMFLLSSLVMDKRPIYPKRNDLPPVSVLIAAYNEEESIADTLTSFLTQEYPNEIEIIVINDSSIDNTEKVIHETIKKINAFGVKNLKFFVMKTPINAKKAGALNLGLIKVSHDFCITIDADTFLFKDAIRNIMTNIFSNGKDMGAVAGSVLARNTRKNWMTRIQEWDYFNGIASVKRTQALYEGTLVAQGAFSAYRTHVLRELGGWKETVGEDIVLTWGIIDLGYKVGYAENAIALTDVPTTYKQFFSQRKRWSRGLVEAFRYYPSVLWKPRKNMPFIYLNLTFPYTDFMFLFFFIPGLIAALVFEYYLLVGFMTLLLLPIALLGNIIMFLKQKKVINDANFKLRHNKIGFVMYILFYQLIMAPAALSGYFAEIFRTKKTWGTK